MYGITFSQRGIEIGLGRLHSKTKLHLFVLSLVSVWNG
jgi:hypothetical protein